jgi:predicted Zn-dependent protease
MITLTTIFTFAAMFLFVQPQRSGELYGTVRVAGKRQAVPFARVRVLTGGLDGEEVITNGDGQFRFFDVPSGGYLIEVTCTGFEPATVEVHVMGMTHPALDIDLKPQSASQRPARLVASVDETLIPKHARGEYERALEARKHSNCDKALAHLEKAIKTYFQYADAHNEMGNCYVSLNKLDQAEQAFKHGIEFGTSIYPYLNLADIYVKEGRLEKARDVLQAALHSNPGEGDIYYALANTYFVEGRMEEAEKAALEADSRIHRIPDLHVLLAKIYLRLNNRPAAVTQLQTYLKEAPDSPLRDKIKQSLKEADSQPR